MPVDYFIGRFNTVVMRCVPALLRREALRFALADALRLVVIVIALTALIAWAAESVRAV